MPDDDAMTRALEEWRQILGLSDEDMRQPDWYTARLAFCDGWRAAMGAQIGNLRTTTDNAPITPANAGRIILEMQDRITELESQSHDPAGAP